MTPALAPRILPWLPRKEQHCWQHQFDVILVTASVATTFCMYTQMTFRLLTLLLFDYHPTFFCTGNNIRGVHKKSHNVIKKVIPSEIWNTGRELIEIETYLCAHSWFFLYYTLTQIVEPIYWQETKQHPPPGNATSTAERPPGRVPLERRERRTRFGTTPKQHTEWCTSTRATSFTSHTWSKSDLSIS